MAAHQKSNRRRDDLCALLAIPARIAELLHALSQTIIVEIVRSRLEQLLPEPLARVQERAERQRAKIERALSRD